MFRGRESTTGMADIFHERPGLALAGGIYLSDIVTHNGVRSAGFAGELGRSALEEYYNRDSEFTEMIV